MKKHQPKPLNLDHVSRDLDNIDESDLLSPSVLAALSELPEYRRALHADRVRTLTTAALQAKKNAAQKNRKARTETREGALNAPLVPDTTTFQRKLADLPIATYEPGQAVLTAKSTTGRLLILKEGAVAVIKEGVKIGKVAEPGAVFGELSVLLDQPHTADVVAVKTSKFYVASATLFMRDPVALLYVAAVLARRLDRANQALIELNQQLTDEEPRIVIGKTIEKIQGLLGASGASLH